ncbi:MAG TPA: transketolase [Patescibacteria group bacterium]|nr:transketolase [Patescibacteria group bacterium]
MILPSTKKIKQLELIANKTRRLVIDSLYHAGSGHPGGSLGMADVFTSLYFYVLKHNPKKPLLKERDRLVLSNGHICPVQYASLALSGYFPIKELKTLRKINSRLQGHPHRTSLPGIETTSGPLGEGLSQAIGIALAAKMDKENYYVYCLSSDGEHQEGNQWEAAMLAGKNKLSNLIQIIDRNHIQISGFTEDVLPLEPLKEKYLSFNWNVLEINGNNIKAIIETVFKAKREKDRPTVIIAKTVPGMGVSFMENDYKWHGKAPSKEEAQKAIAELKALQKMIKHKKN